MWAATPPATISLGLEGVKDGKISVLEGANQQSVLFRRGSTVRVDSGEEEI